MNGMVPYVDFSDSKGPLLYLIYGLGYLLSPRNYIGVFWISVLWYTAVYYIMFRLSMFLIGNRRQSVVASLLMTMAFFIPYHESEFRNEFRAEDICMLFVAIALYVLVRVLYAHQAVTDFTINIGCAVLGFCLGATFLVKYSITAMMLIFPIVGLYFLIREKRNILRPVLSVFAGLTVIFAPFFIYMVITHSLDDFVREYIFNTLATVSGSSGIKTSLLEISYVFAKPYRFFLLIVGMVGCMMFSQNVKRYKYSMLICFLWFMLWSTKHTYLNSFSCYFIPASIFFIFLYAYLAKSLASLLTSNIRTMALLFSVLTLMILGNVIQFVNGTAFMPDFFFYDRNSRKEYYDVTYLMSQVDRPTLIDWSESLEVGIGIPVNALPGTKYFCLQAGYTSEMAKSQDLGAMSGKADFIVIPAERESRLALRLEQKGYKRYYRFQSILFNTEMTLYSKHNLRMPPKDFHVSNMDVLLKREIAF